MERPLDANKVFGDAALSDVTIKFSGRQIRAHKIILSIRSKYFERAFAKDSGFKVSRYPLHLLAVADSCSGE